MAGKTTKGKLNDRMEAFCQEYIVDLNATQAAKRAGYSEKTAMVQGYQLLQKPLVLERIAELKAERAERIQVNQDYVLNSITDTMERCKQAVPVLDARGQPVLVETAAGDMVPAYTFQANSVLKGAELLGKHIGLFEPEKQSSEIHVHLHDLADKF